MSKGARLRADRARERNPLLTPPAFPRPGERIEVRTCPAVTLNTPDAIASMQKRTHDELIRELGDRRLSGVRWKHVHGALECHKVLDEGWGGIPEIADAVSQYRAFIDQHGDEAVMVIALAEWAVPR